MKRLLEHPCGLTAIVSLCFHISLIDTAPAGTKKKIRNVTRFHSLPLSNLGGGFILLGAANK
jgi:hypothetical protein